MLLMIIILRYHLLFICFAVVQSGCTFLNGFPQNTICSVIIDMAKHFGTFVGSEDFKTE